jgi:hypothetical protein
LKIAPGRRAGVVASLAALATVVVPLSTVCTAATIEIHLRDSSGTVLGGVSVGLFPTGGPQRTTPGFDFRYPKALSDGSGVAVVHDVPVGTWIIYVSVPQGRDLLRFELPGFGDSSPASDPQIPAPRLTVSGAEETLPVDVTVQRGDRIVCQLVVDQDSKPGGKVNFEEIATKVRFETYLRNGEGRRLLPPGRWRVWLDPRPGQLLRDFEVDHEPVPDASSAVIETKGEARQIDLFWHYVAPCKVTGRFAWDVGENPPGTVVAHLVRPGGWVEDVQRRGGTVTDRIPAKCEDGAYTLLLLDGAWRLTAEGPRVISSEPDHVDLELAPGDESRADFFVKARPPDDDSERSLLLVEVDAPDGGRLREAHVAVWRLRDDAEGSENKEPLMRADTGNDGYALARFVGLPAGNYRIVAGHRNYLEGRAIFEGFLAKPGDRQLATVVLRSGAEISAAAKDENGAPSRGIELRVEREGDPPPSELDDEELRKSREHRSAVTDETGRLRIGGFDPGRYRLEGALTEQRKGTHFVRIEGADPPGAVLETKLAEGEKKDVVLHLVPAASVTARLACLDRGPFPEKTVVRVLPVPIDEASEDPGSRKDAVFSRDDVILSGREKDALFAGPLPEGTFATALRPDGFDRWTFAPGTEDPDRAVPAVLDAGGSEDLGVIELDCSPTVRVEPEIQTQEPVPDLHDAVLTVAARRVPGAEKDAASSSAAPPRDLAMPKPKDPAKRTHSAKEPAAPKDPDRDPESLPAPRQEVRGAYIRLRGFPEAKVALTLTIFHPYFVPSTITVDAAEYPLERGREAKARIVVPRIGGAIQLDPTLGAALALLQGPAEAGSAAPAAPARIPLDASARAAGILPGLYTVELFSDPEAAHRLAVWKDVVVEPARTTRLR